MNGLEKVTAGFNNPVIDIEAIKNAGKVFLKNKGASIIDIGDSIGLVEFHTPANAINSDVCTIIANAVLEGPGKFDALVLGNNGKHFSAGTNLAFLLDAAENNYWKKIDRTVTLLQATNMILKYAPIPIVAAPFGNTRGSGFEICLHSSRVVAAMELSMGFVETRAGLIPAGGGIKELALRVLAGIVNKNREQLLVDLQKAFTYVCSARVSQSGDDAKQLFLSEKDAVVAGAVSPIEAAKQVALELVRSGFRNGTPNMMMPALGKSGLGMFQSCIGKMQATKLMSDHDATVALHVATILCGGDGAPGIRCEHHFLDLEREAFLSLLGTEKTKERIRHLLNNNKALRN